jgi:hypothetical protein
MGTGTLKINTIARLWLTVILLFLPFNTLMVRYLATRNYNSLYIRFVDEITIALFSAFAAWKFYKSKEYLNSLVLTITIPVTVFFFFGLLSGMINGNSVDVTLLGTIDYIKSFMVVFIYAAFFREMDDIKRIVRLLLILSFIISVLAIVQELWALIFRYILEKDTLDHSMYLFRDPPNSISQTATSWRLGILRVGSLFRNQNILGYFNLLVITIYIFMHKKINLLILIPLLMATIFTVSRSAYAGLFILAVMVFIVRKFNNNKKIILASVFVVIITVILFSLIRIDIYNQGLEEKGIITYREYAAEKCMTVWKDNPFIGAGPGMFGGVISMKFVSYLFEVYNFSASYLYSVGSIDQFWPQVFAEMGIIGFMLYLGIIVALILVILSIRNSVAEDIRGLISAFLIFLLIIYAYTFGTGFNNVSVIFPYFAFLGMTLGHALNSSKSA